MTYLFFAIIFICLQGFFAGMETGMVSVLRPRVEHAARTSNSRRARQMYFFISNPGIMIATTLIGVNISVVCASLCVKNFLGYLGLHGSSAILISTAVLSILLLSCEIIPKNYFRQAPYKRCSKAVNLLYGAYILLYFPVRIFAAFTDFLNRKFVGKTAPKPSQEEFRLFLRESEGYGSLDSETAAILERAMKLPGIRLADIAVPRDKVVEISCDSTVREAFVLANAHSLDHIPVFIQSKEADAKKRWHGIFNVYDAMFTLDEAQWDKTFVTSCLSHIHVLSEDDGLSEAIRISATHRVTLFIICNSKGEQTGIVSPDDIAALLFE